MSPLAGLLGDTVALVRVYPLAHLLGGTEIAWVSVSTLASLFGGTLSTGLKCPPELDCSGGHCSLG